MYMDIIENLTKLPADDGNFKTALSGATSNQLLIAIEFMRRSGGANKTRITACKRELRRRDAVKIG